MGGRAIAAAVLLVLLAAGCSASGGDEASEEAGPASAAAPQAAGDEAAGGVAAGEAAGVAGGGEGAGAPGQEADGGSASAGAGGETPPLPDAPFAPEDRIIKQGTVTLAVEEGGFDRAYARVVEAGRRYGGTVLSSTTRTDDGGGTYGSVTLRVPAESYEDLLVGVGEIGEVQRREITAEDVSEEFVDLQSRQRNLEAQERFYLGLLEEAQGVSDAIAVQQQLSTVTEQLEQVKGRLAYLDERTRFSTLTVELFEPGAPVAPADEPADGPSLARAWQTAQDAFVNVVGVLLVVLVALTPVVLPLALIGGVAWHLARRRRRDRPAPARGPEAGAPPPEDREPSLTR